MGQDLDLLTLKGVGMVACTGLEVREGVGRRRGTSFDGDNLGNATEEVALCTGTGVETRRIWDIACVG